MVDQLPTVMATNPIGQTLMATNPPLTAHEIELVHTIDDIESRRAHMHRMLIDQRFLLAGALDAIRAGDTHVADEFVDRFLAHLDAELAHQIATRDVH